MEEDIEKCKYNHQWSAVQCQHPAFRDGFCIFHLPYLGTQKPNESAADPEDSAQLKEDVKQFKIAFNIFLKSQHDDEAIDGYDFEGFRFPDISLNSLKLAELIGSGQFDKQVNFSDAEFANVDFYRTKFQKANFTCSKFNVAKFLGASFVWGSFGSAKFNIANFSDSQFKHANFCEASMQRADFREAKFDSAGFVRTRIDRALFCFSIVKEASFSWAEINSSDFSGSTILGDVRFVGNEKARIFLNDVAFRRLNFGEKAKLLFEKVNLSQATFLDTDLAKVVFRDVTWCKPHNTWPRREKALYDEVRKLEEGDKRDYIKIAENYSQLVINYERNRDFPTAEQFHIGEMECRRKQKGEKIKSPFWRLLREWFNEYNLYRILNNYGTSYIVAAVWLLVLGSVFVGISLYSGFFVNGDQVNYDFAWRLGGSYIVRDIGHAVGYAFSTLPFTHDAKYLADSPWLEVGKGIFSLVFSGQLALLLLAVRRRFKR